VKRCALIIVLSLLAAAGATARAGNPKQPEDGTLTIKGGNGKIVIDGRGIVIGKFDKGQVTIKDPNPNDGPAPIVTGAEATRDINDRTTRYSGNDLLFRMMGGRFSITIVGTDIDLAVRGKATVTLAGRGTPDDGSFAINDGVAQPIPDFQLKFQLAGFTPPPPTPGG
jgi:hypothetical protein